VSSAALVLNAPELAPEAVLGRIGRENFPVAMSWLPRAIRCDLVAVYGAARLIDEAGDAAAGDRAALLDAVEADLRAAFAGRARHPLLRRLTPLAQSHGLTPEPFVRLIEANRFDQRAPDLASWDDLLAYCALSAQPVGEIVLRVFDQVSDDNLRDSNDVCTALQVLEHCQDVAEDARAGRCYLPGEDRAWFGCRAEHLETAPAPESLRRTVALQVERARELLARGDALCRRLRGIARPVVAAYAGGGWATAAALERAGFDPNSQPVGPGRIATLRHALRAGWWRRA
jgi:squalene synthase HpnC